MSEWTPMINESMSTIGLTKDLPKYLENRDAVLKLAKFGATVLMDFDVFHHGVAILEHCDLVDSADALEYRLKPSIIEAAQELLK